MACRARDGAIPREPRVIEEPASEPNALRRRRTGQLVETLDPERRPRRWSYRVGRFQTPVVASSECAAADQPECREQSDREASVHVRTGTCTGRSCPRPRCISRAERGGKVVKVPKEMAQRTGPISETGS